MSESLSGATMMPTARFDAGVRMAREIHHGQTRKGTTIPYLSHLLAVAGLLMEQGASEDQVIAGLLHDAVEDATSMTGPEVAAMIRAEFGEVVAQIVQDCSDAFSDGSGEKPPWRARKEAYLEHLSTQASEDAVLVSLADKVHNVRAIAHDYDDLGEGLWERFSATSGESAWYYRALAEVYEKRLGEHRLLGELRLAIDRVWGVAR